MEEIRMIVFDMDGTIADLYAVEGWLDMLRQNDVTPYVQAEPMWDMETLRDVLLELKTLGYIIAVTSWLAKESSKEYKRETAKAKREWLDNYDFPYDELHFVQYGTTKANCTRGKADYQILIDDNEKIRKGWHLGKTINPQECNLVEKLIELL